MWVGLASVRSTIGAAAARRPARSRVHALGDIAPGMRRESVTARTLAAGSPAGKARRPGMVSPRPLRASSQRWDRRVDSPRGPADNRGTDSHAMVEDPMRRIAQLIVP